MKKFLFVLPMVVFLSACSSENVPSTASNTDTTNAVNQSETKSLRVEVLGVGRQQEDNVFITVKVFNDGKDLISISASDFTLSNKEGNVLNAYNDQMTDVGFSRPVTLQSGQNDLMILVFSSITGVDEYTTLNCNNLNGVSQYDVTGHWVKDDSMNTNINDTDLRELRRAYANEMTQVLTDVTRNFDLFQEEVDYLKTLQPIPDATLKSSTKKMILIKSDFEIAIKHAMDIPVPDDHSAKEVQNQLITTFNSISIGMEDVILGMEQKDNDRVKVGFLGLAAGGLDLKVNGITSELEKLK